MQFMTTSAQNFRKISRPPVPAFPSPCKATRALLTELEVSTRGQRWTAWGMVRIWATRLDKKCWKLIQ